MRDFYLKVKKLNKHGKLMRPAKLGDAGYDVFATKSFELYPGQRAAIPLGIALEFPEDYVCIVNQKSGLAKKKGILTIGNVIDSGYRGEIHAIVVNTNVADPSNIILIEAGKKIAQLVFHKYYTAEPEYVDELSESERADTGFGSTGLEVIERECGPNEVWEK